MQPKNQVVLAGDFRKELKTLIMWMIYICLLFHLYSDMQAMLQEIVDVAEKVGSNQNF